MMPPELSLEEFKAELKKGTRAILQVRHAERPKMDPDDPSFGDALPLTEEGCRTARLLGEALKDFRYDTDFISSPLRRTTMTAELVASGMGLQAFKIPESGLLGNESFYYRDASIVLEVFKVENFFPACKTYMETGELPGFNNLYSATEALERWLEERHHKQLLIATTHDLYIAAFLCAMNRSEPYVPENWVRFLDGAATLIDADGNKRFVMVRSGLSNGIVGVPTGNPKHCA
jgi:broad specificity phosphatase PhoE